ncbi:MAG: DUF2059 domain-containing protein [Prolixibacteraceae bacterium]|jgi:hypothetical protein|nr:DUF2059 domain-containing protein [Prolixibacteraceae bacterium]
MKKLLFVLMLTLGAFMVNAQEAEFDMNVSKLMELNGTNANYDLLFDQMVVQYKMMKPNVPGEIWEAARRDVFNVKVKELTKQLIPLYKTQFTNDEIKKMIEFYSSPIGKKMVGGTAVITKEGMQIVQNWGMGLGTDLNMYLIKKGF